MHHSQITRGNKVIDQAQLVISGDTDTTNHILVDLA